MPKKTMQGVVLKAKRDKTITVLVRYTVMDTRYHKTINRFKKYHVHDEHNKYQEGQSVVFIESRPISKTKTWVVQE